MRNDGIRTMIPGLDIPVTITIPSLLNIIGTNIGLGIGFYLKAFISKQFALIPRVGINYSLLDVYSVNFKNNINKLTLQLGLGFRGYF